MVDTIGSHPYGSVANRVSMRDYIVGQLTRIQQESQVNGVNRISFEVRDHHGEILPNFHSRDYKTVWESMGNIIVNVHAAVPNTAALLVSGHFDTVTMSKGASDNCAGISSMLEAIEVLSHDTPAKHELMFAFVNGEEYGLLGAADLSMFDSKFRRVSAFINIDGTPGAKQLNLRTTGGFLDRAYSAVPRPLAFVVAGDVFGTGIVDSDTDYSVYSEKIPGLDMVTFSRRQTYHTLKDTKLPEGLLQFQGDNMVALIRRIINIDTTSLATLESDREQNVYFSFLNRGYAVYSLQTNYIVYVMLIVAYVIIYTIIMLHRYIYWKDLGMGSASHPLLCMISGAAFIFGTFIAAFGVVCLFGLISTLFAPMFSYAGAGLIVFAFFPLTMCFIYTSQWFLQKAEKYWKTPLEVNRHRLLWGTGFCWWWLLVFTSGASKRVGSTYLLFFLALFHLAAVVTHHVFFFFGVLNEKVGHDMYEVMENAEIEEDEADKKQYDETGEVRRRPVRPVEHQRWRAALSMPDIAWFIVAIFATWPPMVLFLDVMVPFVQMAATDLHSWIVAPIIAIIVFLLNLNFIPLSRRSHHYGLLAFLLLLISILTYFPLIIGGATTFGANAPYQLVPSQLGDRITFTPEHSYSYSLKLVSQGVAPDHIWTCGNKQCSSGGFPSPPIPTTVPISPPHGFQYAARINSSNAWVHRITFPEGTKDVLLNGLLTTVDPFNATVNFLLSSHQATTSWTVEYNGPFGLIYVQSWWDDINFVPSMTSIINKLPTWATLKGRGSWLASHKYSVPCA
jgi:hypothetical protein